MKKTIIAIMVTVCVMGIIFGCVISYMTNNYEAELIETKETYDTSYRALVNEYNELSDEYEELSDEMNELEFEVYRVMEGEDDYEISLDIDGEHHTYRSERDGWFTSKSHLISY